MSVSRNHIVAATVCFLLCACKPPEPVPTAIECLPMTTYTADQEKALADALTALDAASPIIGLVTDYKKMRDADRACLASHL